tara:strand:- start:7396 stop:7569 length:174 start_codon:yes stop_codon:yes gene_type:complete
MFSKRSIIIKASELAYGKKQTELKLKDVPIQIKLLPIISKQRKINVLELPHTIEIYN